MSMNAPAGRVEMAPIVRILLRTRMFRIIRTNALAQLDLSVKDKKSRGTRARGKTKNGGSKITGIVFRPGLGNVSPGFNSDEVLISSNDDR